LQYFSVTSESFYLNTVFGFVMMIASLDRSTVSNDTNHWRVFWCWACNSLYHGTKFAIEGISESLALELAPHGIRVKIIEPGGVRTDFSGRSLELMQKAGLNAYDASMQRVMPVFTSADRQSAYSEASDIADVIYTAATDGTDRLRYLAGKDAEAMSAERARMSDEEYALWAVKHFNL
jgi:NAD(P)-dependent dehydrogenase (short-subunit alcohol dehydrogenase family)